MSTFRPYSREGRRKGRRQKAALVSTATQVQAYEWPLNACRTAESCNTQPQAFCLRPGHLPLWQGALRRRLRPFLHLRLVCNVTCRQLFWISETGQWKFWRLPSIFLNKGSTESEIQLILLFITTSKKYVHLVHSSEQYSTAINR